MQWVPIGLTWVFLLQFKNFQVLIMSKNEVGFFLPIRLIRHASGRGGAGGAFPGYLGSVLVCPKHLDPGAPWSKKLLCKQLYVVHVRYVNVLTK